MKINLSDKLIAWLALLSGLSISAVAIYYSVAGLVSIFAAAVIPITIMGVVLETGKLAATVWLKQNWTVAPRFLKSYLLIAITVLMLITSMGIFGYLSKAHLDQAVPTGDIADKVALIDEKIKTERENIDAARRALKQMDEAVDQTMARSDSEQGAQRAVQVRRNQQAERARLQKDIATAQTNISRLNEERSPIAKELRKVEAEVGPIKYIAALIYGDQTDQNMLEAAVRWVIIIIVLVFDPLAVILLLASQYSFAWFRQQQNQNPQEQKEQETEPLPLSSEPESEKKEDEFKITPETHSYLFKPWVWKVPGVEPVGPMVYKPEDDQPKEEKIDYPEPAPVQESVPEPVIELDPIDKEIVDDGDETDTAEIIELKRMWKEMNPHDTLKNQRRLLAEGAIPELPWLSAEFRKKKKITYMEKIGKTQIRNELSEE